MSKIAEAFALILLLIITVNAGRIKNGDVWVDYANAGQMT